MKEREEYEERADAVRLALGPKGPTSSSRRDMDGRLTRPAANS
jgi:hypothetical protein